MQTEIELKKYRWSKYNHDWQINENFSLIYNSISNLLFSMETEIVKELKKGRFELEELQADLVKNNVLVNFDQQEQVRYELKKRSFSNELIDFWIYPTLDCNFHCSYCFEDNQDKYMTIETLHNAIAWCKRKVEEIHPKKINITLMGGEPLLNIPIIEKFTQIFGSEYSNISYALITNGSLLSPENIKILVDNNVNNFQITLDGPPSIHNKRRQYRNGQGTFDNIFKNLLYLVNEYGNKVEVNLRINVDKENINSLPSLLKILKKFNLDKKIILLIGDTMHSHDIESPEYDSDFYVQIINFCNFAKSEGFRVNFSEITPCWLSSERWFMIDPVGDIYKCPSFIDKKEFAVGNVSDLLPDQEYYRQCNLVSWEECLDCQFVGLCSGGCRYRRYLQTGLFDEKKHCRKDYIKQIVETIFSDKYYSIRGGEIQDES